MTQTPSEQAKRKACELANAQNPSVDYRPDDVPQTSLLYALALHLDEVDRVAREIRRFGVGAGSSQESLLLSLMLPDDPLEEIWRGIGMPERSEYRRRFRAELDKRGLTLTAKP